ncbi:MAG: ECF transporter S component, partial [Bacilli bacterium]|nr:ECF transporter S component [Bacilli bacterium]MBN2876260.1 ECF transporter S component [Bacilli bacterium]
MKTRELVLIGIFVALGVVIPQAIHFFGGPNLGSILLPMHLPVFIGAMLLGSRSGIIIGVLSVFIGILIGMPPFLIGIYMAFELATYGLISGLLYHKFKWNIYLSFLLAKLAGMIVAFLVTWFMISVLTLDVPAIFGTFAMFVPGIPGIALQLLIVPPIVYVLERR